MTGYDSKRAAAADKQEPAQDYAAKNPLGGPAKIFDAMAACIRAGDSFDAVLRQYGFAEAQPAQEPAFKWHSVFQEMPAENSHILFCFGVHIVEGSFTKNGWESLAYGTAQPDFWAYFPPPPHHKRNQELYAMPPKREWVGLTDDELYEIVRAEGRVTKADAWHIVENLKAKLKEKNNG